MILSIDPGNIYSGWVLMDEDTYSPIRFGKDLNEDLLSWILNDKSFQTELSVIEMMASYGMPVGAEVFDTCVWIGRFYQTIENASGVPPEFAFRQPVKLHHCLSPKANDATVKQALVDRFARGQSNYGKGTKSSPGWFYGFMKDIWSAYAIAVYYSDKRKENIRG